MKKILFVALLVLAPIFASCGNKAANEEATATEADSVLVDTTATAVDTLVAE